MLPKGICHWRLPGVAEPCLEIAKDVNNVYKYTAKGNLVAVITNGTAVLGLGDITEASKPVMEGRHCCSRFLQISMFSTLKSAPRISMLHRNRKEHRAYVWRHQPRGHQGTESFEIERRLVEELNIPVMHDDQHGTAIISSAALLNALELAKRK
jgi:malate dehydrogenase (oxaloacetate-decarboxylating)(NADP+)